MQDRNKQDERDQSDRVGKDKQLDQGKQDERSVNITFHISHESMKSMKELMKELNEDMEKGNLRFREMESLELRFCDYMEYRGYRAQVEFDEQDNIFVGAVMGIKDRLVFHGTSSVGMAISMVDCIEDYIKLCEEIGKQAEQ